jgi:hypothetical protein
LAGENEVPKFPEFQVGRFLKEGTRKATKAALALVASLCGKFPNVELLLMFYFTFSPADKPLRFLILDR